LPTGSADVTHPALSARVGESPPAALRRRPIWEPIRCVAIDAVELFGAAGISFEMPINHYFRDFAVSQIVEALPRSPAIY
jgi:hypothetical protein